MIMRLLPQFPKSSTFPEMTKPWKLILLLAGIFVAGAVTGAFVVVQVGHEWFASRLMPDHWPTVHLKKLSEKLDLKPEQADQILPILRRNRDDLNQVRTECQSQIKAVFERMEHEISAILTPEQRPKYEKLIQEMREKAKKTRFNGPGEPPRGRDDKPEGPPPPPPPTSAAKEGNRV